MVAGSPPLRVPVFMMATRGRRACTITGEFELSTPWCKPRNRLTVGRLVLGHIILNSIFRGRSPGWAVRNRAKGMELGTDIGSSSLLSKSWYPAHCGLDLLAPGSVVVEITAPAEATMRQ